MPKSWSFPGLFMLLLFCILNGFIIIGMRHKLTIQQMAALIQGGKNISISTKYSIVLDFSDKETGIAKVFLDRVESAFGQRPFFFAEFIDEFV
jgi:hypothetical protein